MAPRVSWVGSLVLLTLIMPIDPAALSVNQTLPSGPAVIPAGFEEVERANSLT